MNLRQVRTYLTVCSLVVFLQSFQGPTHQNSDAAKANAQQTPAERDGQSDFEFEVGSRKIHLKRFQYPLAIPVNARPGF
jgi:hypothetical protein